MFLRMQGNLYHLFEHNTIYGRNINFSDESNHIAEDILGCYSLSRPERPANIRTNDTDSDSSAVVYNVLADSTNWKLVLQCLSTKIK